MPGGPTPKGFADPLSPRRCCSADLGSCWGGVGGGWVGGWGFGIWDKAFGLFNRRRYLSRECSVTKGDKQSQSNRVIDAWTCVFEHVKPHVERERERETERWATIKTDTSVDCYIEIHGHVRRRMVCPAFLYLSQVQDPRQGHPRSIMTIRTIIFVIMFFAILLPGMFVIVVFTVVAIIAVIVTLL